MWYQQGGLHVTAEGILLGAQHGQYWWDTARAPTGAYFAEQRDYGEEDLGWCAGGRYRECPKKLWWHSLWKTSLSVLLLVLYTFSSGKELMHSACLVRTTAILSPGGANWVAELLPPQALALSLCLFASCCCSETSPSVPRTAPLLCHYVIALTRSRCGLWTPRGCWWTAVLHL